MSTESKSALGFRIQNPLLPRNYYHLESASWREREASTLFPIHSTAQIICDALNRKPKYKNAIIVISN